MWTDPLPDPVLVDPPNCACQGRCPQMREHTELHCGVITTAELNELTALIEAGRDAD